jgi:hypothetical protein
MPSMGRNSVGEIETALSYNLCGVKCSQRWVGGHLDYQVVRLQRLAETLIHFEDSLQQSAVSLSAFCSWLKAES